MTITTSTKSLSNQRGTPMYQEDKDPAISRFRAKLIRHDKREQTKKGKEWIKKFERAKYRVKEIEDYIERAENLDPQLKEHLEKGRHRMKRLLQDLPEPDRYKTYQEWKATFDNQTNRSWAKS